MDWSEKHREVELTRIAVDDASDILPEHRATAVGDLLAYHNLGTSHRHHTKADLLIGTCMDYRVQLRIPTDFAFVLRSAGANLGLLEFDVSFAIAVGGVRSICLIGHDGCRMVDVTSKREAFVSGLIANAGWDRHRAEEHFDEHASRCEFGDTASFVWQEAQRLQRAYAGISVAPLMYSVRDHQLCQITDSRSLVATAHGTVPVQGGEERQ